MKKALFLSAVLLLALSSFADTIINNFTGYNDGYRWFGDGPGSTQTYGEIFTAPQGVSDLSSFSFYTGNPIAPGNIILGAYIGTWSGDRVRQVLYDSGKFTYDNLGNETLTFNTAPNGVAITPGQQYIVFLSTTEFHGQSSGSTYFSNGGTNDLLNGFAYYANGSDFYLLLESPWEAYGLSPDLAVNIQFDNAPEPTSLVLLGTGMLTGVGVLRRRLL